MAMADTLNAYLVDDEPLAIERLGRLLSSYKAVRIMGSATDPAAALELLNSQSGRDVDVLFLDIQMPGINGFELLSRVAVQPFVIFTTAYDQYALQAFEVNSIDYLLKPVETEQLERALAKLGRLRPVAKPEWQRNPELPAVLKELAESLLEKHKEYPRRIASRLGDRISFLNLDDVTHFVARDKLTYAVINGREYCIDDTIADLERRLDPAKFLRIHRAVLLNLDWVEEMNISSERRALVALKDARHSRLPVARDRVRFLKAQMEL